jgi:dephospho-CoA kinase
MGAWAGKFVIGLTGNIATGKSVVRTMLEKFGAYGIDADSRVHQILSPGLPGHTLVIELFGRWIIREDGQVDRKRLSKLVFTDPDALKLLEGIIHPLVENSIKVEVQQVNREIIVIEAIKLIEAGWMEFCDTLWVTVSSRKNQLKRLMEERKSSKTEALQRIQAQPSQEEKIIRAEVILHNDGTLEEFQKQVFSSWATMIHQYQLQQCVDRSFTESKSR